MPYHYKSDGSLDMRYSSSKAAVSSGGGNSSYSGFSSSNYGSSGSNSSSGLHYKKDGSLDMRYLTSKAVGDSSGYISTSDTSAISSPSTPAGNVHYKKDGTPDMRYASAKVVAATSGYYGEANNNKTSSAATGDLHYKKDGTPDMRYSTSKAARDSSGYFGDTSGISATSSPGIGEVHYKKDGTPDMRYSTSKTVIASGNDDANNKTSSSSAATGDLHYKKDGSLDMRYKSSKGVESRLNSAMAKVAITPPGIPSHIRLTKSGLPDMRSKAAKEWVMQQSESYSSGIPAWLPRKKDGSLDTSKAVTLPFLSKLGEKTTFDHNCREQYYTNRLLDTQFKYHVDMFRKQSDTNDKVSTPKACVLTNTSELKSCLIDSSALNSDVPLDRMIVSQVHGRKVQEIDYNIIHPTFGDEEKAKIGTGGFGVVLKGTWKGKSVAVKRLHLSNLNKREKVSFVKEIKILTLVGQHPNLVTLFGYCVDPPCLVMEFVELGSLAYLLHYCSDPKVEAAITDGRVKKKLISGVANGVHQLHEIGVVHADLKPANVLVDSSYTAKITDFGLATFRGKTNGLVVSTALEEGDNIVAGTGAYMAPELLDSDQPPEFQADVYSFGILLNEVLQEEEPFSGQEANFHGRGPFGAANYAKLGKRPFIKDKTPSGLKNLIENCWNSSPANRPSFMQIVTLLEGMEFPNSF